MNYILQLNGFWNWVRLNEISHLEVDLYLSILDMANTSSWKTQFAIPNSSLGRFDKNSLARARNKLMQCGLIRYEQGRKGKAPLYSIVPLYKININPNIDTNNDTNNFIVPISDTYIDTNIDTNNDTNNDTNMIPIQGTYINKNIKEKKIKQNYKEPPISPYDISALYNQICKSYPKVTKLSDARKKAITARLKKYSIEEIEMTFQKAETSDFLKGANDRNWSADFDWLMKDANIAKVLDGKYDNRSAYSKFDPIHTDNFDHETLEVLTRKRN